MSKLYAVGDIHGRLDMLEALIPKVPFRAEDRIVFIGDFVDRGPDSKGVVKRVLGFKREFPGTVCLRGNHEDMLLDFLDGTRRYQPGIFFLNGGDKTLRSYDLDLRDHPPRLPQAHVDFFRSLPLFHRDGPFLFVHAGLRPGVPLSQQDEMDLLWLREEFFEQSYDFGYTVVFGHTPLRDVFDNSPYAIGIDTGATFGNKLTCVELGAGPPVRKGRILATYQVKASELG